jgi:hypothetical protein
MTMLRWNEFVHHYAGVIEDGSLEIRAANHGLQHVKQVTFIRGREAREELPQIPFDMVWHIELLDGRSIDVDVNARPPIDGGGAMIVSGVQLNV